MRKVTLVTILALSFVAGITNAATLLFSDNFNVNRIANSGEGGNINWRNDANGQPAYIPGQPPKRQAGLYAMSDYIEVEPLWYVLQVASQEGKLPAALEPPDGFDRYPQHPSGPGYGIENAFQIFPMGSQGTACLDVDFGTADLHVSLDIHVPYDTAVGTNCWAWIGIGSANSTAITGGTGLLMAQDNQWEVYVGGSLVDNGVGSFAFADPNMEQIPVELDLIGGLLTVTIDGSAVVTDEDASTVTQGYVTIGTVGNNSATTDPNHRNYHIDNLVITTESELIDETSPQPDPMSFAVYPTAESCSRITMTASTAVDACSLPVEYYFECTTDGDFNSSWQSSVFYSAGGLDPNTAYAFRIKARDSAVQGKNETAFSDACSVTTPQCTWPDFTGGLLFSDNYNVGPFVTGSEGGDLNFRNDWPGRQNGVYALTNYIEDSSTWYTLQVASEEEVTYPGISAVLQIVPLSSAEEFAYLNYDFSAYNELSVSVDVHTPYHETAECWSWIGIGGATLTPAEGGTGLLLHEAGIWEVYINGSLTASGSYAPFPEPNMSAYLVELIIVDDLLSAALDGVILVLDEPAVMSEKYVTIGAYGENNGGGHQNTHHFDNLFIRGNSPYATGPYPYSGETAVDPNVVLRWDHSIVADANYQVYFGTDSTVTNNPMTELDVNSFDPCGLELLTTYYWKVDVVNDTNTWQGAEWNFTTDSGTVRNPNPADNLRYVGLDIVLNWTPGAGGPYDYEVYFGTDPNVTDNPMTVVDVNNFDPCGLTLNTEYYWQVDAAADTQYWPENEWTFITKIYFEMIDLVGFSQQWLNQGCSPYYLCDGFDLDYSSNVDFNDFALFGRYWQGYSEVVYDDPNITVTRGDTIVIIPLQTLSCTMSEIFKFNNGEIRVRTPIPTGLCKRSSDDGKTWFDSPLGYQIFGGAVYQYPEPDGEMVATPGVVLTSSNAFKSGNEPNENFWTYTIPFVRSTDNGYTEIEYSSTVYAPMVGSWFCFDHGLTGLSDGTLLVSAAANFVGDSKERTVILTSTDRGNTWVYTADVAIGDDEPWTGPEGFTEPDLLLLESGKLLCFMRTGGGSTGYPMAISESYDNGQTWVNTRSISDWGVWPNAAQCENGVVAVFTGRPGNWIEFSANEGQSWEGWYEVDSDPSTCDCTHYNDMAWVYGNTFLAVYNRTTELGGCNVELVGTFFTVNRKNQ